MQGLESLIFLGFLIAIFYFMLIRPQKRRVQQHRELVESTGIGDEVVTIGGMHGTVRSLDDETVELEVAPGTNIRFVRTAIARRLTDIDAVSEDDEDEEVGETGA